MAKMKLIPALIATAMSCATLDAQAELLRVGPLGPYNYPDWYQDTTGLALDLCIPQTQAQLDAGLCVILPADVPSGQVPESVPNNFSEEHFYWATNGALNTDGAAGAWRGSLVLALEAAFGGAGTVADGQQIVFGRVRMKVVGVPSDGTYTITHPYGKKEFPNLTAGDTIFYTDDIGFNCGELKFDCALSSHVGPFLLPIDPVTGLPKPYFQDASGAQFISDGVAAERVAGSPFNTNFFRIEGPNIGGPGVNVIETNVFTMAGKVHTAPIASPLTIERATYARGAGGATVADVFATAVKGPLQPEPSLSLSLAGVRPNGTINQSGELMPGNGRGMFYGQGSLPASNTPPNQVVVFNNADVPVSAHPADLVDEVRVTGANYDPSTRTLTVAANSLDRFRNPKLFVDLSGYATPTAYELVGGTVSVPNLLVPPPAVSVRSELGGQATRSITTALQGAASVVANNDAVTTPESVATSFDVLANDTGAVPTSLAILGNPLHGTAVVDANTAQVRYTPTAFYNGPDTFTYQVSGVDGRVAIGSVAVTVTPVNNVPTGTADRVCTLVTRPVTINALANDTDPDSNINPASVVLAGAAPAYGNVAVNSNGTFTYTPNPALVPTNVISTTDTFFYQVSDTGGVGGSTPPLQSGVTAVTVKIYLSETVQIARAQFVKKDSRWVIDGSSSIADCGQIVTAYNTGNLAPPVIGTSPVDILGGWQIQVPGSAIQPNGTRLISVQSGLGGQRINFPVTIK